MSLPPWRLGAARVPWREALFLRRHGQRLHGLADLPARSRLPRTAGRGGFLLLRTRVMRPIPPGALGR